MEGDTQMTARIFIVTLFLFFFGTELYGQYPYRWRTTDPNTQNEPAIAVSPLNKDYIFIGWNDTRGDGDHS
jgi:hypothetical protein